MLDMSSDACEHCGQDKVYTRKQAWHLGGPLGYNPAHLMARMLCDGASDGCKGQDMHI